MPVSSEYSAPTTIRPFLWINPSRMSDPLPELVGRDANVRAHRLLHERAGVVAQLGREQRFHRRANAVDDRAQVPRLVCRWLLQVFERRQDRAALRVSEHHDQPRTEAGGGELDAADLRRSDDVAGDADDEQIAEPLIEDDFGRHAGVRATEDDRERLLRRGEPVVMDMAGPPAAVPHVVDEPAVTLAETVECC